MVKVYLDVGHGGSDPGALGHGLREKDLTLRIGLRIAAIFKKDYPNVGVKLSRTGDVTKSLRERTNEANRWGADCLVSVHINAGGGTGWEIFIYNGRVSGKSKELQEAIHDAVQSVLDEYDLRNRGMKRANFHMLRESRMPAVLSENLFIDTIRDAELLRDDEFIDAIARAHVDGVVAAFGLEKGGSGGKKKPKKKPSKPKPKKKKKSGNQKNREIQQTIIDRYGYKIAVDGIIGPETLRALLMAYQTELNRQFRRGLIVDGLWGPLTRGATVNVRHGARGNLTWILQAMLEVHGFNTGGVDGVFGDKTERALRAFQRSMGLVEDGVAGKQTWSKLFN